MAVRQTTRSWEIVHAILIVSAYPRMRGAERTMPRLFVTGKELKERLRAPNARA